MAKSVGVQNSTSEASFRAMVELDIDFKSFVADWYHCDCASSYLARMISHNRPDSVLFSALYSSAINELLEIAFRTRHPAGVLACRLSRHEETDRIELTFACAHEERRFYEHSMSQAQDAGAEERYLLSLSGDVAPSRDMVLVELALDYNATLRLLAVGDDTVTLVVDLPVGGLAN